MIVALPSAVFPALAAQEHAGHPCESDERPCGLVGGVHRDLELRDESGLTAGIGLEVALWIGRSVQMAATWEAEADRFEVESRSRVGLGVRVAVGAAH